MNGFDSENCADSDSDCENYIDMPLNCPIDESSNAVINDDSPPKIFEWKVSEEQDSINSGFHRKAWIKNGYERTRSV